MTVLEEFKEVALSSTQTAQSAMSRIPSASNEEALSEFRDLILDLRVDVLAFYKVAVLEVRRTDEPEEVAKIWKEVLSICEKILAAWEDLPAFDPVTQGVVNDYRRTLQRIKVTVTEHYKFHAEE